MEIEYIGGVKTIWHTPKEETLKSITSLLLQLLFENDEISKINEEVLNENEAV